MPIFLLLILVLSCQKNDFITYSPRKLPILLGCESSLVPVELSFQSELRLLKKSLPAKDQTTFFNDQIRLQMQYMFGMLHYGLAPELGTFRLSDDPPSFEIKGISNTNYQQSIMFENDPVPKGSSYLQKLYQYKKVGPLESAVKIKYQARMKADFCGPAYRSTFDVILPPDPEVGYWLVPPSQRRPIKLVTTKEINPCSDSEFVDLMDPFHFSYTWSPFKVAKDAQGKKFSCKELLGTLPKVSVSVKSLSVPSVYEVNRETFLANEETLQAAIIFGFMNRDSKAVEMAQKFIEGLISKKEFNWQELKKKAMSTEEPGLMALFNFLNHLEKQVKNLKLTSSTNSNFFLAGVLNDGRKIKFEIFYGETDLEWKKDKKYASFLVHHIEHSPLIFYVGHSGMGVNLTLERIAHVADISPDELKTKIRNQKEQVFSFTTCFSSSYFGSDILLARKGLKTDLFLSTTPYYIPNFPVLFFVNLQDKNKEFKFPKKWVNRYFIKWVHQEHES